MLTPRIRAALVVLAASAGLGACTNFGPYGGLGVGLGNSGYGSYGYNPYYSGYGYGNPYGYYGWYDGFYYPGAGYWVYDPDGNPRPITERQSAYWRNMLEKFREARGTAQVKENWSGFRRPAASVAATGVASVDAQADQRSLRQISEARRQARIERQQAQSERQQIRSEAREQAISESRQERRVRRGRSDD